MLKKILILALLFVPLLSSAQSKSNFNIIINVNQEIAINENLEFSYSIKSNTNQDIQYIPKIECPNAPQAMLGVIDLSLKADEEHKDDYFSMKVFKFIEPQECIAIINIICFFILSSGQMKAQNCLVIFLFSFYLVLYN